MFEHSWNTTQDNISSLPPDDLEYTDEDVDASTLSIEAKKKTSPFSPNLELPFYYGKVTTLLYHNHHFSFRWI